MIGSRGVLRPKGQHTRPPGLGPRYLFHTTNLDRKIARYASENFGLVGMHSDYLLRCCYAVGREGAFFHHFDSKETLVTELMQMLLTRLDKEFDELMAEEENSDGCFTRAYIRAAVSEGAAERKIWARS
jgi:hypothetical protein